jgi:GNAT superfamily N-acetyltransferase
VALLLDPPVSDQVDGLRRAIGDDALGRIPSHLTLVPPINVRHADLALTLGRLRAAAATVPGPFQLTLGPPATFLPANPVLYLDVGGDVNPLRRLRDAVFAPPLERPLTWPWVPHVTLAESATPERIAAALTVLDRFAVVTPIDRVVLLEEGPGRVWSPLADAALGSAAVVGRGGLALEITRSRIVDPEAHAMLTRESVAEVGPGPDSAGGPLRGPLVLTARRETQVTGVAAAWIRADGTHVWVHVAREYRREGIGSHLLAHLEMAVRRAGWDSPALHAEGPAGFYRLRSSWSVPATGATGPTGVTEGAEGAGGR